MSVVKIELNPNKQFILIVSMQVRSLGRRQCGGLFLFGDELIQFNALHSLLAVSVCEMLPVNVTVLLGEDSVRRTARPQESPRPDEPPSFQHLMTSSWKVRGRRSSKRAIAGNS